MRRCALRRLVALGGVPFYVRAGKNLKTTVTEVFVELKNPPQVVFREAPPAVGNYVRFRLGRSRDRARRVGANGRGDG